MACDQAYGERLPAGLRIEAIHDLLLDPAPVGDRDALALGPFPNRFVLLPVGGGASADSPSRGPPADHHSAAPELRAGREEWRKRVAQLGRVLLRQVDLILNAV